METSVKNLFERYERFFGRSLSGDIDTDELASLYAPEFIAASPHGVTFHSMPEPDWRRRLGFP